MRKKVPAMDREKVVEILSYVSDRTRDMAIFNAVDVPMVRDICCKAKADFHITYGKSGISVSLGGTSPWQEEI